ncbi:STAS domain-containing protein [Patescibacteria group bacterium]|nr:STAS domain-containing protein [Patescibacteria group bacterium]
MVSSEAEYRTIKVRVVGHVTVATLVDKKILNDMLIDKIGEELFDLAAKPDTISLVVSFEPVMFLASRVLGKLITLRKRMSRKGGYLRLSDMNQPITELFELASLDKMFDIRKTEADALASF